MSITEEQFIEVLTKGHLYRKEDIAEYLRDHINDVRYGPAWGYHPVRRDSQDDIYYVYDNECYLFIIEDNQIVVRCDRENVWSEGMTHKFAITKDKDINHAYEVFKSMTMEDENEGDE